MEKSLFLTKIETIIAENNGDMSLIEKYSTVYDQTIDKLPEVKREKALNALFTALVADCQAGVKQYANSIEWSDEITEHQVRFAATTKNPDYLSLLVSGKNNIVYRRPVKVSTIAKAMNVKTVVPTQLIGATIFLAASTEPVLFENGNSGIIYATMGFVPKTKPIAAMPDFDPEL